MAIDSTCCGCHLEDDYGTSIVSGDGSAGDPYSVIQTDPLFNRPVVSAFRAAAQSIPNNTDTPVEFQNVSFDTDSMWDPLNPSQLVIPVTGLYLMGMGYQWASSVSTPREIYFRLNGVQELERQSSISANATNYDQAFTYLWFFAQGDFVEAVAFQTSGGNLALGVSNFPFMWMTYLGKKV